MVADFTPLIYAKRYSTPEIVDLLIKNGAKEGPADAQKIEKWIKQGAADINP